MPANDPRDYVKTWNNFWSPICAKNGSINMDQVMRELHDFHRMMGNVSKVYDHITGGKLSKPNYDADVVIQVADERIQDLIQEALKEEAENRTQEWLPIDTAPRDGAEILIARIKYTEGKPPEVVEVDVAAWTYDAGMNTPNGYEPAYWYWASNNGNIEEPSHWLPLPAISKQEEPEPVSPPSIKEILDTFPD